MTGEVGRREPGLDVLQLHAIRVDAAVAARAGRFDGDAGIRIAVTIRLPEHLHVAEEEHPVRAPVVDDVRKDIDVHELTVGLTGADLLPLSPRVAQADGRLAGVGADAEHVELELPLHRAVRRRHLALDAERGSGARSDRSGHPARTDWPRSGSRDGRFTSYQSGLFCLKSTMASAWPKP